MSGRQLFETWAPPESVWTPWAKPVLFAHMPARVFNQAWSALPPAELGWKPSGDTAVVVDAPGAQGVAIGMALARAGHRPVPLYNTTPGPMPLVACDDIMRELVGNAKELASLRIAPGAAPAFLLDSERMSGSRNPGHYDNRWMVFEQDFPSATFLKSRGIRAVALLGDGRLGTGADLLRVLGRWKKEGLSVMVTDGRGKEEAVALRASGAWRAAALLALIAAGIRFNSAGGFGARVPMPGEGGGYG